MKRRFLALLFLLGGLTHGQTTEEDQTALADARQRLQGLGEITDENRAWSEALTARIALFEELARTRSGLESLPEQSEVEQRRVQAQAALDQARAEPEPGPPTLASPDDQSKFEQASTAAAAELVQLQSQLEDLRASSDSAQAELASLSARGDASRARQAALTEGDELTRFLLENERVERRVVGERSKYLTEALSRWDPLVPVFELDVELAQLLSDRAHAQAAAALEEANRMREESAAAERGKAEEMAAEAKEVTDPVERILLDIRGRASHVRAETTTGETLLDDLSRRVAAEQESIARLKKERDVLEQRLRLQRAGADQILRPNLERIRKARELLDELTFPRLYEDLSMSQDQLAKIIDVLWDFSLTAEENATLQEKLRGLDATRREEAATLIDQTMAEVDGLGLLRARRAQLEKMDGLYTQLSQLLAERVELLGDLEEYVMARMMWSRSVAPIGTSTLTGAFAELGTILDPYREPGNWRRFATDLKHRLPAALGALGALVGLYFLRRKLAGFREVPHGQGWRRACLHVASGTLWALALPLQLWILGWVVRSVSDPGAFNPPLATALEVVAVLLLFRRLVSAFLGDGGIAVQSGRATREIGSQINRLVHVLTFAGIFSLAPYTILQEDPFNFVHLPRLIFPVWILCAFGMLLLAVRRGGAMTQSWTRPGSATRSVLRLFEVVIWIELIPVVAMDFFGYHIGALAMMLNSVRILVGFVSLTVVYQCISSLGKVVANRMMANTPAGQTESLRAARGNAARVFARLSGIAVVVIAALLLQQVWGLGDPLRRLLENIPLTVLEDGRTLTGYMIYRALLWIAIAHLIVHNLARIQEVFVSPFVRNLEVGSTYATVTLLRYAILSVAYLAGLLSVGFSFTSIGWIMTAASVGLGFGLQEVVANFISGLILLFERPFRVGDIVSIGTTSGTVERVTMRATVITNWERQTMIVPNKSFITQNLTNWTHNDKIMRRDFTVRVAYGSDVEKVLRLLDELVGGHPAVLTEPPHQIWFQDFGEFGIEFRVLFFTIIDAGLSTRSELHALICARFAQEGIEIPVIQRDLRVAEE